MTDKLFTIAEMAQSLDLPESTVRYYRDRFADFFPVVGEGRKRRYPPEAMEVLKVIAEGLRTHHNASDVEDELAGRFPKQATSALAQWPLVPAPAGSALTTSAMVTVQGKALQQLTMVLSRVIERVDELSEQETMVNDLQTKLDVLQARQIETAQSLADRIEEHDRRLMAHVRSLMAERQAPQPWWRNLFHIASQ